MKSIEELKKEHKEQLNKLKAAQKAEFERIKALTRKKEALELKTVRKAENHIKFLLAGELIAEMKQDKDVSRLRSLAGKVTRDKDKAAIERLIGSILESSSAPAIKPESSEPLPETEPVTEKPKRRGLFGSKE